jgi:hypothetical protein
MKQCALDLLKLLQLKQPRLQLSATERVALVLLMQSLLLEILFSGIANTSSEESDDE